MNQNLIEQYRLLHKTNPNYGNGATFGKRIAHLIDALGFRTVLDFGCGKGNLINKIKQYSGARVIGYDPAVDKYNDPNLLEEDYDLVIANDVLEHFSPETWMDDWASIRSSALKCIFLNISCRPAVHKLPDGRNCHTLIREPSWWINVLVNYNWKPIIQEFNEINQNLVLCLYNTELSLKLIGKTMNEK